MSNFFISLCIGLAAALIDVVPMIIKKLDVPFILSAATMWIIVGLINSQIRLSSIPALNGLLVALLFFIPLSFLIFRLDKSSLPQVGVSTIFLGTAIGFANGALIN